MVVRRRDAVRVELGLSRWTWITGAGVLALGGALAALQSSIAIAVLAGLAIALGLLLLAMRRTIIVDVQAGVVTVTQGFGVLATRRQVPLFHVREIAIDRMQRGYVASLQTRRGEPIRIDEAAHPRRLLDLAEALADLTAWRTIFRAA